MAAEATRQPTLKQLQAAASKRSKDWTVGHSPKAPDADTRTAHREQNTADRARIDEIGKLLNAPEARTILNRLTAAARFVVDVEGGSPSMEQLAEVMAEAERLAELRTERAELEAAVKARPSHWRRWQLYEITRIGGRPMFRVVKFEADTAAELMAKIQGAEPNG